MTVQNVKILAGFRFHLTNKEKWVKFCQKLHEYCGEQSEESEQSEQSDNESCSDEGSEHESCSDEGSDHEHESCSDEGSEQEEENSDVWENMDGFIRVLQEKFPEVEYNAIRCFHDKEGMDRIIDIGFELGVFSVNGDHEESHQNIEQSVNAIKEAKKLMFINSLNKLFIWEFCVNKRGPQVLGQANDCLFCS